MKKKQLNRSLLSILVCFLFFVASKPLEAQTGLIGYWPFDGNGTDQSGNSRNLTLVGSPPFVTGLFGQAVSLDGTGNMYAQRPVDDSVFDFAGRDFTVSVWVKFNTTTNEQVLIEKFAGQSGPGWTLTKLNTEQLQFSTPPLIVMTSNAITISTGVWHNFIIRRLANDFRLYFDSKLILQQTASGTIVNTIEPLLIGRRDFADGRIFGVNGLIDEAAIWSRSLCDNEITLIWNNGKGTAANSTACCNKPVGLKAKKITSTSATLTWKSVTSAAKYKLQYRVQGTTTWTSKTSTDTFYNATGLAASTVYEFRVQTYCTADGSIKSKFSKIATFSTTALAQNAVQNEMNAVRIYPNPAHDAFRVQINSQKNEKVVITVSNDIGSKLFSQTKTVIKGYNEFSFPLSALSAGTYFVQIQTGEKVIQEKLVKN